MARQQSPLKRGEIESKFVKSVELPHSSQKDGLNGPPDRDCTALQPYFANATFRMLLTARMYCARSKADGSGQRSWLMLPCICFTDS